MEKVIVSACLLGVNCNYEGGNNYSEEVMNYLKDKEIIPICPEQWGGLTTPRLGAEISGDKVFAEDGTDVTKNFKRGAKEVLELAKRLGVKKAVLKSHSPSCGMGLIEDGTFSHSYTEGNGVCAELLLKNGIEVITSDDIINGKISC